MLPLPLLILPSSLFPRVLFAAMFSDLVTLEPRLLLVDHPLASLPHDDAEHSLARPQKDRVRERRRCWETSVSFP